MEDMKCMYCNGTGYIGFCHSEGCVCVFCDGSGYVKVEFSGDDNNATM